MYHIVILEPDASIVDLYRKRLVTKQEILARAPQPKDLERLLRIGGG